LNLWAAGDNSGAHASAPRSQRYWNEHGLNENKPDYAKTDREIFEERWGKKLGDNGGILKTLGKALTCLIAIVIGVSLSGFLPMGKGRSIGGQRIYPNEDAKEQQRFARLKKFEGENKGGATGAYAAAMAKAMGQDAD